MFNIASCLVSSQLYLNVVPDYVDVSLEKEAYSGLRDRVQVLEATLCP